MSDNDDQPRHPGRQIRDAITAKGITVTKAAGLMGVGRPALSNLVNGNASLTAEMAVRAEKALGVSSVELMALQVACDEHQRREQAKEIAVRAHVKKFLGITARQIEAWADRIDARPELAALLRRLINTTGKDVSKVDFPAFDNAERHGWDGLVLADTATPWIPRGNSGWEFGCNSNPAKKAGDDYKKRTAALNAAERKKMTFVFVTPRNWPEAEAWADTKRRAKEWKDVRAYDASALEQWLEQSISAQAWFAETLGLVEDGISSLERCWKEWAEVTKPPLTAKTLFRVPIEAHQSKLQSWLTQPPIHPFILTADSDLEAVAFLRCALEGLGDNEGHFSDRTIVLRSADTLRRATHAVASGLIAVVCSSEVELASAGLHNSHHMLIVRRRNDSSAEPDISLDLLDHETFRVALNELGFSDEDVERLARETGYSPTILRRRLSCIPAVRTPRWASDSALARKLIPLHFAGVWNAEASADIETLKILASAGQDEIERSVSELSSVTDAPLWSIGRFRGVVSKIDVLFAIAPLVTKADLENFFFVAQYVLSEGDPALDLPPDTRWAAGIYGKTRDHSSALRHSICETLVLLAVSGNTLFGSRLGVDVESRVNEIVRWLLTPLDTRTWASQRGDLPHYSEAAPEVFLDILEQDLRSDNPKVYELLRPAGDVPFGGCPRSGLLWALEALAWKPQRIARVSCILAKLSQIRIEDNWSNRPEESLKAVFRAWMPQTAATIDERNQVLDLICQRYPDVGWRLCMSLLRSDNELGTYSARPLWRNDAAGAGQPVKTMGEVYQVRTRAASLALAWDKHDERTFGDMVQRLRGLTDKEQSHLWDLISRWATTATDDAKHALREVIRRHTLTRRTASSEEPEKVWRRAREVYNDLAPTDLVVRHLWLFTRHWVDESADELEDDDFNYEKREARISELRKSALNEIWQSLGYDGVVKLAGMGSADSAIGWILADAVVSPSSRVAFLGQLLRERQNDDAKIDNMLGGFLGRLDPESRNLVITELLRQLQLTAADDELIRLLKCAPFRMETWKHLSDIPDRFRERYWRETYVRWEHQDEAELNILVDRLLEAQRPRAALSAVRMDIEKVEPRRLLVLLRAVATISSEGSERFQIGQYEISKAFRALSRRAEVKEQELVQLEFLYIDVLDHSDYGIPTLERMIAKDPKLFMQLVGLLYRRKDSGEDPIEWQIADPERRSAIATSCYSILRRASHIPGTSEDGSIKEEILRHWIDDVRALARAYGRLSSADHSIGELLGRCPPDRDGTWPCEPVRQVLDAVGSQDIARGVYIGRVNKRGAQWRGEGGHVERDLAAQYRGWAKSVANKWPFTATILEEMARSYDREANWHDTDATVRRRVSHM